MASFFLNLKYSDVLNQFMTPCFTCHNNRVAALATLVHWDRATHICVGSVTIISSDNGLSPGRRQAIAWINAAMLLIRILGTNFSEILIEITTFSIKYIWKWCQEIGGHFVSVSMC